MAEKKYVIGLDLNQLNRDVATAKTKFNSIGNSAVTEGKRIDDVFNSIGRTVTGVLTTAAITSFGQQMIKVRGEIQLLEQSFEVLTGSAEKSRDMLSEIIDLAKDSPLEMTPVAKAAQTLMGFGVETENVMGILRQLTDVSMGNQQRFESLALVYAQTQAAGKLMGQDLLQYINAGFNPLSIIAEQTCKSMATLKDEMSDGAISAQMVADAFTAVTSEGGKFYDMTKKQADTIVGVKATFEDSIVQMFNSLGKENEGLIKDSYEMATAVVQSYEEIGRVLGVLITSYGTYKAAIIAYTAVQKAANVAGSVKAFVQLTSAIKSAKDAQLLLNMAVGANPYIKLASILMTVVGLIWAFAKNSKSAADEVTGLEKATSEATKSFNEQAGRVKALQTIITDSNAGYYARNKAISELKALGVEYNGVLSKEGEITGDNIEVIDEYLVALEKKIRLQAYESELSAAMKRKLDAEDEAETAETNLYNKQQGGNPYAGQMKNAYKVQLTKLEDAVTTAREKIAVEEAEISKLMGKIQESASDDSSDDGGGNNTVKTYAEQVEAVAQSITDLKTKLAGLKDGTTESDDYATDIASTQKELTEAEARYNLLLGIDTKYQKQIADDKAKVEAQTAKELQALRLENQQSEIDLMADGSEKKIAQIKLNYANEIAEISAQEAKWREAQGGELTEDQTTEINKAMQSANDKSISETTAVSEAELKVSKDKFNTLLEQYQTFDQKRRSIEESYTADMAILNTELQKLQAEGKDTSNVEGTISVRTTEYEASIKQLKSDLLQSTEFYQKLFASISDKGYTVLKDFYAESKKVIEDAVTNGDTVTISIPELTADGSVVSKQVDMTIAEYQSMVDQVAAMGDELESRNPFIAVSNSFTELIDSIKSGDDDAIANSLTSLGSAAKSTISTMNEWGDSLGSIFGDTVDQAFDEIMQLTEGVLDLGLGIGQIATGDIVGGITSVLSGIASIVQSLTSWREKEEEQQRNWYLAELELNRLIEERNLALAESRSTISDVIADTEALAWLVENGFAKESSTSQWASNSEALSTAIDNLESEISRYDELWAKVQSSNAEWSGKNGSLSWYSVTQSLKGMSEEQIELYYQQGKLSDSAEAYYEAWVASGESIEELTSTIEELYASMQEMVMGVSFDSWLSSAKDTLQAMQSDISDLADFTEETLQNAILNAFMYQALSDVLEPLYNELSEAFINGSVDSSFIADWKERFEEAMTDASEDLSALSEALGVDLTDSDTRTSTSSTGITASQESVDSVDGRLTVMQGHTYTIAEKITEIAALMNSMTGQVSYVGSTETSSSNTEYDMSSIGDNIQYLRDNAGRILDVVTGIKGDTARLEAIENYIGEVKSSVADVKTSLGTIETKGIRLRT